MHDEEPLGYSVRETADVYRVSERTIWRLIQEGQLDTFKVRGSTRITAESRRRLMAGA